MTVWYKVDPRRFTLRLLWARSSGVLGFLLRIVVLKVLRINPRPAAGFSLDAEHSSIEFEQMPITAQQALRPMISDCQKRGFSTAYYFRLKILGDAEGHAAHLLHADGRIRGVVIRTRLNKAVESGCALISRLDNGAVYSTANLRRSSDLPPEFHSASYLGASVDELFSRHEQRLRQLGEQKAVTLTTEQLPEEMREHLRRTREFSIARGAFRQMTRAEIDRLAIVTAELVPEPSGNPLRSPLADEVVTPPPRRSVWSAMFGGACYGGLLGGLAGLFLRQPVPAPVNPNRTELLWFIAKFYGWFILPAVAGAFLGWLAWRSSKHQTAASTSST